MAFRTNKTPVLQTKSASGAVASFNTALAMPLVNGEFTIAAYQEGSGDPSPDNVRNIVPFNAINITHTHKNLISDSSDNWQLERGDYTFYEPYNAEVKTVALGDDVYGGSYNSVSGVMSKTLLGKIYNGSEDWQDNGSNGVYLQLSNDERALFEYVIMCNEYKPKPTFSSIENLSVKINSGRTNLLVKDENRLSASSFKSFLTDNPMLVVYKLYDAIESNIGATPINTYDGSNNIFCDTGDTSLVYKDLDIAKRGNFREVFRLPS